MRKFKKFYIALLGGILALGVGTSSLVSSVSPTSVKAWDATVSFTFDDDGTGQQDLDGYFKTIGETSISIYAYENLITIDYDEDSLKLQPGNEVIFDTLDEEYRITSIIFTFKSGTVNDFTLSQQEGSFSIDGDNTFLFEYTSLAAFYVNNTVEITQIDVNIEVGILRAIQWAETFMYDIQCDGDGAILFGDSAWTILGLEYNDLTSEAKEYFTDSSLAGKNDTIDDVIERYDFIIGKYGTDKFVDFMGRHSDLSSANTVSGVLNNIDYITIIAIAISVVALTSIAAFIIIYKNKKLSSK